MPTNNQTNTNPTPEEAGPGSPPAKKLSEGQKRGWTNRRRGARQGMPKVPKFEGECEGLKGFIFDYGEWKMSDTYVKTSEKLARYVNDQYKHGADVMNGILHLAPPDPSLRLHSCPSSPLSLISHLQWLHMTQVAYFR